MWRQFWCQWKNFWTDCGQWLQKQATNQQSTVRNAYAVTRMHKCTHQCVYAQTDNQKTKMAPAVLSIKWQSGIAVCSESENVKSFPSHTGLQSSAGARLTKYLTTILRLSYDNATVTINLRRMSNLQNISRWMESFSLVRFTCKIVISSEIVFVN